MSAHAESRSPPARLAVTYPDQMVLHGRRRLIGIDEGLIVHRLARGGHVFHLRPYVSLRRDPHAGAMTALGDMAADLAAGRTLIVFDRDRVLDDLEALASAGAAHQNACWLAQTMAEVRSRFADAVRDPCAEPLRRGIVRRSIGGRAREVVPTGFDPDGIEVMREAPILRSEALWNAFVHSEETVRERQHARAAWRRWVAARRPDMPTHAI